MPRKFILIAGPSGVGKGTLINMLMNEFPGKFAFCVSHTTRDPRPGENHGEHYHFVSVDAFKELKAQQGFVESAEVHGNMYGTSKMAIEDVQSRGMSCILDVDVQGAQQVHRPHAFRPAAVPNRRCLAQCTGGSCVMELERGRAVRCARAVRKVVYFRPVFPDAEGDRGHHCVRRRRTTEILTQSKNSDNELNRRTFPTENTRLLSESAVFAPWT